MKKAIVVVNSVKNLDKARKLKSKIDDEIATSIVLVGDYPPVPRQRDVRLIDYTSLINRKSNEKIYERAIYWKNAFSHIRTDTGKTICELLSYRGISVYWLLDFFFNYILYNSIKNLELAKALIEKEKPDVVFIIGNSQLLLSLKEICKSLGINVSVSQTSRIPLPLLNVKRYIFLLGRCLIQFIARRRLPKLRSDIVFIVPSGILRRHKENASYENVVVGPIVSRLKTKFNVTVLVGCEANSSLLLPLQLDSPYYLMDGLWLMALMNLGNLRALIRYTAFVDDLCRALDDDFQFREQFSYLGVSLWKLNRSQLSRLLKKHYILAILGNTFSDLILSTTKPAIVVIVTEYGGPIKELIAKSKIRGIPVYAIQHGIIHRYHPGYVYTRDNVCCDGQDFVRHTPLPDLTFVAGEYFKDILTMVSAYPKDSVIAVGLPKYDVLVNNRWRTLAGMFLKDLGFNKKGKTVVLTTQTPSHDFDKELNKNLVRAVAESIKKMAGVNLIIKTHPNEQDVSIYYEVCQEVGVKATIVRDINILKLLYCCDLLITVTSTTALEAMLLMKPVIICNFLQVSDPMKYESFGMAELVDDRQQLLPTIRRLLFNVTEKKKMKDNQRRVISHFIFNDGNASRRIANIIERTMEKSAHVRKN